VVPGLEGSGIPTLLPSQPIHVYMVQITSAGDHLFGLVFFCYFEHLFFV
jgi:hypothetical protein